MHLLIWGLIFMVPIAPGAIFGTVYNASAGMVTLVSTIGLVAMIFSRGVIDWTPQFGRQGHDLRPIHRGFLLRAGDLVGECLRRRYRQLPKFLSTINSRQVPQAVILDVSVPPAILVLFFVGEIDLIASPVNFGALFGFMLLRVFVVVHYNVRNKSKNYVLHLVVPVVGFLIIGYVMMIANDAAQIGGVAWLVIGLGVYLGYRWSGRRTPTLGEETSEAVPATGERGGL